MKNKIEFLENNQKGQKGALSVDQMVNDFFSA